MLPQGAGDFLEGLDAGSHGLAAPSIEKFAGPSRRVVVPELLKGLLEEVSADRFQVVAEEIAEPELLFGAEVLIAAEQQPTGLLEHGIQAFPFQAAGFLGADFVEGLVHVGDDVEAVEDMQGLETFFTDDLRMVSSPFASEW
jgi:hypothetical protein